MASKGGSRTQRSGTTLIDMKRFAYDVIEHSVSRLQVPGNCIGVWKDSKNDYGWPNFCKTIFRVTFPHQMALRYALHKKFNHWYEFERNKNVRAILKEAIEDLKGRTDITDRGQRIKNNILDVEISLSVTSELVIFLYSKNMDLSVEPLAGHWLSDYFRKKRRKFDQEGGLTEMYKKGFVKEPADVPVDDFYDDYISKHCHDYEASVKSENLGNHFYESKAARLKEIEEEFPQVKDLNSPRLTCFAEFSNEVPTPPLTSRREKAPEIDLLENPALGIKPHEELLRDRLPSPASKTPSQNLPGASSVERAKRRHTPSDRQKRRSSLSSSVKHGLGQVSLHSSGTKQSSGENSREVSPPPLTSRQEQAPEIDPLENPGLGIKPHEELLRDRLPSPASTTPSENVPGASSLKTAQRRRAPSDRQKRRSSLSSSVKHGLGQVGLHSSGTKQSSGEKSKALVAHDPTPAQKSPGASPGELEMHLRGLPGLQKIKSRVFSSVEKSLRQLSLDSSVKERSSEEKAIVSVAGDPTSFQNLPGASCQASPKEQRGSSGQKEGKGDSDSNSSEE